jgi:hypothetical protein
MVCGPFVSMPTWKGVFTIGLDIEKYGSNEVDVALHPLDPESGILLGRAFSRNHWSNPSARSIALFNSWTACA